MQAIYQIFAAYFEDDCADELTNEPAMSAILERDAPISATPKSTIKYVSRYLGLPVISLSRIGYYDGQMVTFHYNKHEDNSFVQRTLPAIKFIQLLIQHIPEKQFNMTRYYGLYARHREIGRTLHKAGPKSKHRILLDFNTWHKLFLLTMGYDPLQCPKCRHEIVFLELYHKHGRVPLDEFCNRKHGINVKLYEVNA